MSARICVIAPGLATAVQDAGRRGYEHLGCMVGGWLDDESARAANQLVGNLPTDALLEIALIGPTLEFPDGGWAALTGADLGCTIDGEPWPPGGSRRLPAGARVAFGSALRGLRAYLAVAGGIDVASILESRATDLVAGFGGFHGRLLRAGDDLTFAAAAAPFATLVSAPLRTGPVVRVLPGPACDDFRAGALDDFLTTPFRVGLDSDRVGLRLDGAAIADPPTSAISKGVAIGAIEIPADGRPLVLLKSRGSIGGYPTIAVVIAADLPILGQIGPGDPLRFAVVDEAAARAALRERANDRRLRVAAPEWCVIDDLPPVGARLTRGAPLARLGVMGSDRVLHSPIDGTVAAVHAENGYDRRAGEPLVDLLAGV